MSSIAKLSGSTTSWQFETSTTTVDRVKSEPSTNNLVICSAHGMKTKLLDEREKDLESSTQLNGPEIFETQQTM